MGLMAALTIRPAAAKVYRRFSRGDPGAILSDRFQGRTLYESAARLNGARGTVRVLAYDLDFDTLRTALGTKSAESETPTYWRVGRQHALGVTVTPANAAHILLLGRPGETSTLCFRFDRQTAAHAAGGLIPAGLPMVAGAAVRWTLELERSGLSVASGTAMESPEAVALAFDRDLQRQGWQPAGGRIYLKDNALLAVQISRTREHNAATQVTVVRRTGGSGP